MPVTCFLRGLRLKPADNGFTLAILRFVPGWFSLLLLAWCLVAIVTRSGASSAREQGQGDVRHPRPELLIRPISVTSRVSLAAEPLPDDPLVRRFAQATLVGEIGSMDGRREEVFGNIEDVAIDAQGSLYVLDARNNKVRVFDRTGRFLYVAASPGRGPGELSQPRALAFDHEGSLLVANVLMIVRPDWSA